MVPVQIHLNTVQYQDLSTASEAASHPSACKASPRFLRHTHTLCVHSCPPCCFAIFFHGLFLYSKSTEKTLRCLAVRVETTAGDCYTHTPNRLAAARVVLEGSIVGAGPLYYKLLLTIFFLFVFFMFLFIWLGKIIIYLYFSPSLLRLFFYSVFLNECTLPEQD